MGQFKWPLTPLIAALRDENYSVRRAAAGALGELGDPRAVEPLIATLRDEDSFVRDGAIVALGRLGDPRAVQPLMSLIDNSEASYQLKLDLLRGIWTWDSSRAKIEETMLDADLATLRDLVATESPAAVVTNPYLVFFSARIHQENSRSAVALDEVKRAQTYLPLHETAYQIAAGWIQIQALHQSGQTAQAFEVVNRIERELLPDLIGFERRTSQLAFESQTLILKGILLSELNRRRQAIETFYAAEDALNLEQQKKWVSQPIAQRLQYIISGHQTLLLKAESEAKSQQALNLAKQNPPVSWLEKETERKILLPLVRKPTLGDDDHDTHELQ